MNNRAFIVSEKNFPERLCLFYIDDEQPHSDETIKLVMGTIYESIDKTVLAKHEHILRIKSIVMEAIAAEPAAIKITSYIPRTRRTRIADIAGYQTTPVSETEKKEDVASDKTGTTATTETPSVKVQSAEVSYGYIGNEAKKFTNLIWSQKKDLHYEPLTSQNINQPEIIYDEMHPTSEPFILNSGNCREHTETLFKRFDLDETWGAYFKDDTIPSIEHTDQSILDDCLAKHPYLKKLTNFENEKLDSVHPASHKDKLTKEFRELKNILVERINQYILNESIANKAVQLNETVNKAFRELYGAIENANFGNAIAELDYQKTTLIYQLRKAAQAYAKKKTKNFAESEEKTALEHFMATAKLLDDNFHGIAYLDAKMHYQTCDLSAFTINNLVMLVNSTLNPSLKASGSTTKQDKSAYKKLVKELQPLKAPFLLKKPMFYQISKFAELELDESHKGLEQIVEEQQRRIKEKRDALVAALNARENYPATVLQAHLDSLSPEEKKVIKQKLKRLEKHASEKYCAYQEKVEKLKAAKKALVDGMTQHCDKQTTPTPLTLPEAYANEAELLAVVTEYETQVNNIIAETKIALEAVNSNIPTSFRPKEIKQTIATVKEQQEKATRLIEDETRKLHTLQTDYQQKIAEKQAELETAAEEARQREAAEEARQREAAEEARRREAAEEARRREVAEAEHPNGVAATAVVVTDQTFNQGAAVLKPTTIKTDTTSKSSEAEEEGEEEGEERKDPEPEASNEPRPQHSKKHIAVMAAAVTGSILAGVGVTFLCALTLPASLPILVAIAIGAAASVLIGASSITTTYCCLFKPNNHRKGNKNALQPSIPGQPY